MPPHLLRCQGLAVNDYSFALGRLEAEAPSTFAQLGNDIPAVKRFSPRQLIFTLVLAAVILGLIVYRTIFSPV